MAGEGRETQRAVDAWLAASARAGDARAFALLVRRWNGKLTAHAWRLLGDPELARDAVQDGWAEIVRSLPRLADTAAFPAWAYRIVSRRCAKAIGKAVYRRRLEQALEQEPPAQGGPELLGLREAIAALPPDQRAAVALYHLEDMSVTEVRRFRHTFSRKFVQISAADCRRG